MKPFTLAAAGLGLALLSNAQTGKNVHSDVWINVELDPANEQ